MLLTYELREGAWAVVGRARADGAEVWAAGTMPVCQIGAAVILKDSAGTLLAVDAATGQERWRFDAPGGNVDAFTFGTDGERLLAFNGDGGFAVDVSSGQEAWHMAVDGNTAAPQPAGDFIEYSPTGVVVPYSGAILHIS